MPTGQEFEVGTSLKLEFLVRLMHYVVAHNRARPPFFSRKPCHIEKLFITLQLPNKSYQKRITPIVGRSNTPRHSYGRHYRIVRFVWRQNFQVPGLFFSRPDVCCHGPMAFPATCNFPMSSKKHFQSSSAFWMARRKCLAPNILHYCGHTPHIAGLLPQQRHHGVVAGACINRLAAGQQ